MKTYLTYGFAIMLGNALVTLICYLLGFHSDPDKLQLAKYIAVPIGLAVAITATTLGMRDKRKATPPTEEFSYGRAFATGFMIALFAALFGAMFHYTYATFINPGLNDVLLQAQKARLAGKGLSDEKIEHIQNLTQMLMNPAIRAIFSIISNLTGGTVLSLIIAAFVKRPAVTPAP